MALSSTTSSPTSATVVRPAKFKLQKLRQPLRSPSYRRRIARQTGAAVAVAVVAIVLTGLSLSHLAHGIHLVTLAPAWEAWSMAIGIDLGFIALEIAQLCAATPVVRRDVSRFSKPAILGTLLISAVLNGLAFGAQASGWMIVPAAGLGVAVPALIYALSRVAFGLSVGR